MSADEMDVELGTTSEINERTRTEFIQKINADNKGVCSKANCMMEEEG